MISSLSSGIVYEKILRFVFCHFHYLPLLFLLVFFKALPWWLFFGPRRVLGTVLVPLARAEKWRLERTTCAADRLRMVKRWEAPGQPFPTVLRELCKIFLGLRWDIHEMPRWKYSWRMWISNSFFRHSLLQFEKFVFYRRSINSSTINNDNSLLPSSIFRFVLSSHYYKSLLCYTIWYYFTLWYTT